MKNVRVVMTDASHVALTQKAIAAGYPDIESFLLSIVGEESIYMDLFKQVRERFESLNAGSRTTLRQLMGPQWDEFHRAERINVGKMFASAVENGLIEIESKERGSSGHAIYVKK